VAVVEVSTITARSAADAVLDLEETRRRHILQATLPLGDVEALQQVRSRCPEVQTRPAGATCLVDARLPACR
jgi:hypothetical protein